MKKCYKYFLALIILLGFILGGLKLYSNNSNRSSQSIALGISFDSLDSMCNSCVVIIRATVSKPDPKCKITNLGTNFDKYPVNISKLIKNTSKFDEAELKTMSILSSSKLSDFGDIEPGEYLLFLNIYKPEGSNESFFVINSPNHLYKKSIFGYKNIASDHLSSISLPSIEAIVKKNDKN